MKIIRNDRLIRRNSRIGAIATLVGLLLLVGAMVFLLVIRISNLIGLSWVLLFGGFIVSQLGVYFGNRFGRSPRPDELLDRALKGMDERYTIYHYSTVVSHLLVGPAGLWILLPHNQNGKIIYAKGRWKQTKTGCFQAYLRFFAQEGIGRPDLDIPVDTQTLLKYFQKNQPDLEIPPIQTALVFTNESAELDLDNAPTPSLPARELKEFLRKKAKENPLGMTKIKEIVARLDQGQPAETSKTDEK